MAHGGQPADHGLGAGPPALPEGVAAEQVEVHRGKLAEVDHVLEGEHVVHRRQLEMAAVGQDLFRQFPVEDGEPGPQPEIGFRALEEAAGENERPRIGEEMVAEQVPFERPRQDAGLQDQAPQRILAEITAFQRPRDPVPDPPRQRIGFPADALHRRVFGQPAGDQRAVPIGAPAGALGEQVVEIVQMVEPELRAVGVVPAGALGQVALLGKQQQPAGTGHRRGTSRASPPASPSRALRQVGGRKIDPLRQASGQAVGELHRFQVEDRPKRAYRVSHEHLLAAGRCPWLAAARCPWAVPYGRHGRLSRSLRPGPRDPGKASPAKTRAQLVDARKTRYRGDAARDDGFGAARPLVAFGARESDLTAAFPSNGS